MQLTTLNHTGGCLCRECTSEYEAYWEEVQLLREMVATPETCECGSDPNDPVDGCWCHIDFVRSELEAPAEILAEEWVKLTGELEEYDSAEHYAPTPEEYEAGNREAYTPNSVLAFNRHNRTNYDKLIMNLVKGDTIDQVIYAAIRNRVNELTDPDWDPTPRSRLR